ncbi:ArsR family transcriptional regulator [Methanolapillus ohkumae]|uniref:HTH arsR-type domain-containing protein n=1 Tax=Methanolapillus ohkumae TaxID=3028298 RepID=A0AA96ZV62_9EURY|nr:hypothetical protein MsAm2_02720 [Methanosarcinaceae archaeon Am2]
MDPSEILDILGNENRRKILALLADRPFYVSEISSRIGVAPKAVIGHLTLLEKTGLIESSIDEQRRKYYNISRSMRLEVFVSPYSYSAHVNRSEFEFPSAPTYSLSVVFQPPETKAQRKSRMEKMMQMGRMGRMSSLLPAPVIFLAPSFPAPPYPDETKNKPEEKDFDVGLSFDILLEEDLKNSKRERETKENSEDMVLKSREGYFLSQIHRVQKEMEEVLEEQVQLSHLQKELDTKKNRLMNSFIHFVSQLSEDDVDLDILFRLFKDGMNAAGICHVTGYAPSQVLPRLKNFEEKGIAEKYLFEGDFFWRLKNEEDLK